MCRLREYEKDPTRRPLWVIVYMLAVCPWCKRWLVAREQEEEKERDGSKELGLSACHFLFLFFLFFLFFLIFFFFGFVLVGTMIACCLLF